VADDLVDDAKTEAEALEWIGKLEEYVRLVYADPKSPSAVSEKVWLFVDANFPVNTHFAFKQLPVSLLPKEPIYELLEGFKMDLAFGHTADGQGSHLPGNYPIRNQADLKLYASRVASTVGELCLWLVFHHCETKLPEDTQKTLVAASQTMGQALQYVNIARDISTDAEMERVYLPTTWLKEEDITPRDVIKAPRKAVIDRLRERLLNLAFLEYDRSRSTMDLLSQDVRGPLIVAVESYMEIGRVLREGKGVPSSKKPGRATVPKTRRLWVAWKVLSEQ
jgi:15-cis-phytoene synthase / lycopene beta-cyclase